MSFSASFAVVDRAGRGARAAIVAALAPLLLGAQARPQPGRAAPAAPPAAPPVIMIGVIGDMPYQAMGGARYEETEREYRAVLDTLAARPLAAIVHVGDFTGATCTDSLYARRRREFDALPHPVIYTPGDNEWTDCARDGKDPAERLAALRRTFFAGGRSMGRRTIGLERQSPAYPENARWRMGDVLFATVHVVGSNDNAGRKDDTPPAEYAPRRAADLAWIRDAFAIARRDGLRGVALFMQANPELEGPAGRRQGRDVYVDLKRAIQVEAAAFGKPVVLVHGDSHYFRIDKPFTDPRTGRQLVNVTRVETFGNPNHHAVLLTIDPANPNLFRAEPILVTP